MRRPISSNPVSGQRGGPDELPESSRHSTAALRSSIRRKGCCCSGCGLRQEFGRARAAGIFGVPLVRLTSAPSTPKWQGGAERRNLRESLHSAEGLSPCVLWVRDREGARRGEERQRRLAPRAGDLSYLARRADAHASLWSPRRMTSRPCSGTHPHRPFRLKYFS